MACVLGFGQRRSGRISPRAKLSRCVEQRRRPQQAADMLGAERRLLARHSADTNIHDGSLDMSPGPSLGPPCSDVTIMALKSATEECPYFLRLVKRT